MAIAAELTINSSATATDMANEIFGSGVTVLSATYSGDPLSSGIYSGATTTIPGVVPTNTGVILSTGNVADFTNNTGSTNTNEVAGRSTDTTGGINGDLQLNAVSGQATFDGAILTANFIPTGDFITMQFVFTSEEYPEYVSGNVNDSFGVWVNGVFVPISITVAGNIAIDEVNGARNENLYRDNTADQFNTEMDGLTYVLSLKAPVNSGVTNTIKIGIADGGDAVYDSNLLIMGDSIQTVTLANDDDLNVIAGQQRTFDILANDSATAGNLTITQINGTNVVAGQTVTLTSGQQVRLNADGTVTVFANGTVGQENLAYTVSNGIMTDVGYVTINTVTIATRDGIISGTTSNDVINGAYLGDADGDRVDSSDGLGVMGTTGNADLVYAGAGDDTIIAGDASDIVYAGIGNDSIDASLGNDTIYGDAGNDLIYAGGGNDRVLGGEGSDTVYASDGADIITGGAGADTIFGESGNDTIDGGFGSDYLSGGAGNDSMQGGEDSDTFNVVDGFGVDIVVGGETGADSDNITASVVATNLTATYSGVEAGTLSDGTNSITFSEIEILRLGTGNDTVFGSAGNDVVYGGNGNDNMFGADGNDSLFGENGNDSLSSGAGNDSLYAGSGNDTLAGGTGADFLDGASGMDYADYSASSSAVSVNLQTGVTSGGDAQGDTFTGIDGLFGSAFNDVLIGSDAQGTSGDIYTSILYGAAGDDSVDGGVGNDSLYGGTGNDMAIGGTGDDLVAGDAGRDVLYGGAGNDTLQGGADADIIYAGANDSVVGGETATASGTDNDVLVVEAGSVITYGGGNNEAGTIALASGGTLTFSEIENIVFAGPVDGTAGNDVMNVGYTDPNSDQIDGSDGDNDTIFGYGGNDLIVGGDGLDTIYGGNGADTISGGNNADVVLGGDDADLFFGGMGDSIDGGEGGYDFDLLDLTYFGKSLTNINYNGQNSENGTVDFLDSTGAVLATLSFSNIEKIVPCFTPGIKILTEKGEVVVEYLEIGDRVLTRDNGFQTIRWIGRRDLTSEDLSLNPHLMPVTIEAGALSPTSPDRTMKVSPQHRMLMSGFNAELLFGEAEVLVAAQHLIGLSGIHRDATTTVSYIHIMFDQHEIISANGAWTESFQPGDFTLKGMDEEQRAEICALFPELADSVVFPAARRTLKAYEARTLIYA